MNTLETVKQKQKQNRREIAFGIMDKLEESGESFNADKVAQLCAMGKQTVLPYYNEWRILAEEQKKNPAELPDDVVQVLKRTLTMWKLSLSKELVQAKTEAESVIEDLKKQILLLEDDNELLLEKVEKLAFKLQEKEAQEALNEAAINNLNNKVSMLTSKASDKEILYQEKKEELQHTCEHFNKALEIQEEKNTKAFDAQLKNWMQIIEIEKKQLEDVKQQVLSYQKNETKYLTDIMRLEDKYTLIENQNRSYQKQVISLKENNKINAQELKTFEKLPSLLFCHKDDIHNEIKRLIEDRSRLKDSNTRILKLEEYIKEIKKENTYCLNEKKKNMQILLEYEKLKGYVSGLKHSSIVNNKRKV